MKDKRHTTIERVLDSYARMQINLASESARVNLAGAIIRALDNDKDSAMRNKIREDFIEALERKKKK